MKKKKFRWVGSRQAFCLSLFGVHVWCVSKAFYSTQCDLSNVGWCTKCQQPKPDRCHHCHICDQCILKVGFALTFLVNVLLARRWIITVCAPRKLVIFELHLLGPWVSNCLGFRNYKYFVQMLVYSVIVCLYYAIVGFCTLFHVCPQRACCLSSLLM